MAIRYILSVAFPLLLTILVSCATPVAPQGGPPDRTPPVVERTDPVSETVNFDGRRFRFTFSKFLNRSTFLNAVTVEPDLGINFDVSWRRQTAIIEFERNLPDNTTIIIRLGTELSDTRNNNLATPFQMAVSTGPEIDDGRITGRIRRASDGAADSAFRVFLYREPFDLSERANYVAQTDTSGRVELSYLSEGEYMAMWVDDVNRNRIWDQERERAQPFHQSTFRLERGEEYELGTIFVDRPDTTRPLLQGVGLLTHDRLRLRFNEEVYWEDESVVHLEDTLGNYQSEAVPLYVLPDDNRVILAQSEQSLDEDQVYLIRMEGFTDRAGNPVRVTADPFSGSAQPDTISLSIIGDNSWPGLFPDEPLVIGYNKRIDDQNVLDSLRVVAGDQMIEPWPHVEVDRHRLRIYPESVWESGISYQFLVWNPYREQLRPIEPVIWQRNQLGSLEISLADTTNSTEHHLRLFDHDGKVDVESIFTNSITIDDLPPVAYTVIVFRDEDGSGSWDPGTVIPFQRPEPYFVRTNLPIREGFTSELEIEFDVPQNESP